MANETNYIPCRIKGNDTTLNFPFGWNFIEDTDVVVSIEDATGEQTTQTLGDDYTINAYENGGEVVFKTAPADNEYVIISRKTSNLQKTKYSTSTGFQGSDIEKSFDRFSCNLQEMDNNIENFKTTITNATDEKIEDFETEVNNKIEQVNDAVEKLDKLDSTLAQCETYSTNAINSANQSAANLAATEQLKNDVIELSTSTKSDITNLGASVQANIQALGIFMENDRLFYIGSDGVKREFRNDFGGIAPMPIKHKDIQKVDTGFALTWTDPDDSYYKSNLYCKWNNTVIVRKLGSYPGSPFDGDIVLVNKVRNQYANTPYVDEVDNTQDYKYRAFPCSTNRVYNLEDTNKFGQWIYSFVIIENQSIPSERVEYAGSNEHYEPSYMDFTNKVHKNMDWENAPFYQAGRLDPVMLYNAKAKDSEGNSLNGQIAYFLDRDNYAKKADGTASDVTSTTANMNAMMRIKTLYRRIKSNSDGNTEISISNEKVNDDYLPYGGFVKPDGTIREYIYLPIYKGCLVGDTCLSISGQLPMNSKTAEQERTYCKNNGADWDMITTEDMDLIQHLFLLTHKTTDSQSALGNGYLNAAGSNRTTANSCCKSGTLDNTGIHSYGMNNTTTQNKFLGMENVCGGNQWHRCLGEVYVNGVRKVKRCQGTSDGSTVADFNFTGEGYNTLSELPTISGTSGGYISKAQTVDNVGRYPIIISGSSTTNDADGGWFNNTGTMVVLRGGASSYGAVCGVFTFYLADPASAASWGVGSSVSYKPS